MKGTHMGRVRTLVAAALTAAMAVSLLAASSASAGAGMTCPGTFQVQNNDRIMKRIRRPE